MCHRHESFVSDVYVDIVYYRLSASVNIVALNESLKIAEPLHSLMVIEPVSGRCWFGDKTARINTCSQLGCSGSSRACSGTGKEGQLNNNKSKNFWKL